MEYHEQLPETAVQTLRKEGQGDLHTDEVWRASYACDGSQYMIMPLGVYVPRTREDVALAMRLAYEHEFPLIMRGGGSGLAGESLGRALIVDTTRHLNKIHDLDTGSWTVRCDAGLVLDTLNAWLGAHGLKFGPDPSSSSRAAVGSLVANNSTGAHSLVYGHTRHRLKAVEAVLCDGSPARFEERSLENLPARDASRESAIYRGAIHLLRKHAALIQEKRPKTKRDRAGYLLYDVLGEGTINIAKLLCPSEGTLAALTTVELQVDPLPRATGFVVLSFPSAIAAAWSVRPILTEDPTCVELLDATALNCIRMAGKGHLLPPDALSLLFVEFYGESQAEVNDKIERLIKKMRREGDPRFGATIPRDAVHAAEIWAVRKAVEPTQHRDGWAGHVVPAGFIEDAAVDPDRLGEYLEGLSRIMADYGRKWGTYGHAGAGVLHTRVYLDLSRGEELDTMQKIAEDVMGLVLSLGGTISGEHGTGLVRTQFLPRQYGELFLVLQKIKQLFDPKNILNPGKIVGNEDPELMKRNLRLRRLDKPRPTINAMLHWEDKPDWLEAATHCTGCGECRTPSRIGRMCPSFKDSADETKSTRARCNLMRMIARGDVSWDILFAPEFDDPANYCLNCKMCLVFCPVSADGGKLMAEARAQIAARRGHNAVARLIMGAERLASLTGGSLAKTANFANSVALERFFMEMLTGFDRRRPLPPIAEKPFLSRVRAGQARRAHDGAITIEPSVTSSNTRSVVYFVDQFANQHDPSLAEAFVAVMMANNIRVVIPPQRGAGMPQIDFGDLKAAWPVIRDNVANLAPYARQGIPIVCTEPTAALALSKEYADIMPSEDAAVVGRATREATDFLRDLHRAGELNTQFKNLSYSFGYHTPCHLQRFEFGRPGMELIGLIPGVTVELIDEGCCGLAGAFGWSKKQYGLSRAIASHHAARIAGRGYSHGATECSLCRMQLEHASGKTFLHPIKVLAEAYGQ